MHRGELHIRTYLRMYNAHIREHAAIINRRLHFCLFVIKSVHDGCPRICAHHY